MVARAVPSLPALVDKAVQLLQAAIPLSFVQLVMRVALAVPF